MNISRTARTANGLELSAMTVLTLRPRMGVAGGNITNTYIWPKTSRIVCAAGNRVVVVFRKNSINRRNGCEW